MYIKQGSDLWFQNRNLALVTGSSCFDVLGLNTLAAQKTHYDHYVLKKPKEITPETQAYFDHRNKNEINAVASIVGVIMPAIFPPCHIFVEVGPYFLGTQDRQYMLEVSADGFITCRYEGQDCPHNCSLDFKLHSRIEMSCFDFYVL